MTLQPFSQAGDSVARTSWLSLMVFALAVGVHAGTGTGQVAAPPSGAKGALAVERLGFHFDAQPKKAAVKTGSVFQGALLGLSADDSVFVMPKVVVSTRREKLTPNDMLTDQGKTDLAEKTCLSPLYRAVGGPLVQLATYYFDFTAILGGWHPNEAEARTIYEENERLRRLTELDDLMKLDTLGRKVNGALLDDLHVQARREGIEALYGQP